MKSGNQSRFSLPGTVFSPMRDEQDLEDEEEHMVSLKKNPRKKVQAVSSAQPKARK